MYIQVHMGSISEAAVHLIGFEYHIILSYDPELWGLIGWVLRSFCWYFQTKSQLKGLN